MRPANIAAPKTHPDAAPAMIPDSNVPTLQPRPVMAPQPRRRPPTRPRTAWPRVGRGGAELPRRQSSGQGRRDEPRDEYPVRRQDCIADGGGAATKPVEPFEARG